MEQKDYLLREIEKIGVIIKAIRQKIFGCKENLAITLEHQIENAKGQLLNEMNFDLDKFLDLNIEESNEYILSFEGFNIENIELLAECVSEIGFSDKCDNSKKYLEKARQLYELCTLKNKTYSIERETNIMAIKNALAAEVKELPAIVFKKIVPEQPTEGVKELKAFDAAIITGNDELARYQNVPFFSLPDMRVIWLPFKKLYSKILSTRYYDTSNAEEVLNHYFGSLPRIFNDVFIGFTFADGKTQDGTMARGVFTPANTAVPEEYFFIDVPAGIYIVSGDNSNHEKEKEKLAKYGYIHDYIHFGIIANRQPTPGQYIKFPPNLQRICKPKEKYQRFYAKLKTLKTEFKKIGDVRLASVLFGWVLKESGIENEKSEAISHLAVTMNMVNHYRGEFKMLINNEFFIVQRGNEEYCIFCSVDFMQKIIRISNGSHVAEFPLSEKLEMMIINKIYNPQRDNFNSKITFA